MKLKYKEQQYQANAVESVADCFAGQPPNTGIQYRIDPGQVKAVNPFGNLQNECRKVSADFFKRIKRLHLSARQTPGVFAERKHGCGVQNGICAPQTSLWGLDALQLLKKSHEIKI